MKDRNSLHKWERKIIGMLVSFIKENIPAGNDHVYYVNGTRSRIHFLFFSFLGKKITYNCSSHK